MSEKSGMTIAELVQDSHERARRKGWWDEQRRYAVDGRYEGLDPDKIAATIPEKLALIHSEVSEALECYRDGDMFPFVEAENGKPTGFPSELADIVIRVCDLAGALGIDLEGAIRRKAAYNETRPHRHGGKRC